MCLSETGCDLYSKRSIVSEIENTSHTEFFKMATALPMLRS